MPCSLADDFPLAKEGLVGMRETGLEFVPRAVVFDLDGLLLNTEELYEDVGGEVLRRRGKQFTHELMHSMMGRPPRVSLRMMIDYHDLADSVDDLARECETIFSGILDRRLSLMPGASDLLAALEQAAIPKAIATSSGPRFVQDVLGRLQLVSRFQFILTCDDVVEGKPHPEVYLLAARKFQLQPSELLVLEDSHNGCRAAVAAGTVAVAVPSLHSHGHDFSGAHMLADTLGDPRIYRLLGLEGGGEVC